MNAFRLALRYIASRPSANVFTALGVCLGVALLTATLALTAGTKGSLLRTAGGYQLLVAAKGSAVQAVLSTLFFADAPTGNIPVDTYHRLQKDPGVRRLVPFNFGDSYRGFMIVGTTDDYFAMLDATGESPTSPSGDASRSLARPFDAVVGASVARQTGLAVGDRFVASHGLIELPADLAEHHEQRHYTVVSVMPATGTPADRAIFTSLDAAWAMHGPAGTTTRSSGIDAQGRAGSADAGATAAGAGGGASDQITALLVEGRGYGDTARIAAAFARDTRVQAIFPGREVTRLLQYLRAGEDIVLGVAWLATGVAFMAVVISMAAAGIDRRRQIATLRALGASRAALTRLLVLESTHVAGAGALAGLALGRAAAYLIAWHVEQSRGFVLALPAITGAEVAAAGAAVLLGMAAGAVPAWFACREDIAPNLAPTT